MPGAAKRILHELLDGLEHLRGHDGDVFFNAKKLETAAKGAYKSREILTHMSPDDFLAMAERIHQPDPSKAATVAKVLNQGKKFDDIPHLAFDHDGKGTASVVTHEGRHRAMALKQMGVESMPVLLHSRHNGKGPAIRWDRQLEPGDYDRISGVWPMKLVGETSGAIPFPVEDPLSPIERAVADFLDK